MPKIESLDVPVPGYGKSLRVMFMGGMWEELLAIIDGGDWKPSWSDEGTIRTKCKEMMDNLSVLDSELDYVDNHD